MIAHVKAAAARLIRDENGAETLEYAFIIGLITIAAITLITAVGNKALGRWTSISSGLNGANVKKS